MEYTEEQKARIRADFAARRRRQFAISVPIFVLVMGMAFLGKGTQGRIFGIPACVGLPAALILVVGAIAFSLIHWRCPACNRYLGKQLSPKYCSRCGVTLQ